MRCWPGGWRTTYGAWQAQSTCTMAWDATPAVRGGAASWAGLLLLRVPLRSNAAGVLPTLTRPSSLPPFPHTPARHVPDPGAALEVRSFEPGTAGRTAVQAGQGGVRRCAGICADTRADTASLPFPAAPTARRPWGSICARIAAPPDAQTLWGGEKHTAGCIAGCSNKLLPAFGPVPLSAPTPAGLPAPAASTNATRRSTACTSCARASQPCTCCRRVHVPGLRGRGCDLGEQHSTGSLLHHRPSWAKPPSSLPSWLPSSTPPAPPSLCRLPTLSCPWTSCYGCWR